jgi:hypothetical protein
MFESQSDRTGAIFRAMIYCVVPQEMADELYDRLVDYYADDPNVKVIVDRRKSDRRRASTDDGSVEHRRVRRDRRRARVTGEFPPIETAV